jgi:hypothetical protein
MTLAYPKPHAHRDKAYRAYIEAQPCAQCGRYGNLEQGDIIAAHMRCLGGGGTSLKPSDYYCVPLHSISCHQVVEHAQGASQLRFDPARAIIKLLIDYFVGEKP